MLTVLLGTLLVTSGYAHDVLPEDIARATQSCEEKKVEKFTDLSCCFSQGGEPQRCLDLEIRKYAEGKTTREVIVELEDAMETDHLFEQQCHPIAHAIGRWTYVTHDKSIQEGFHNCTSVCQSGCFHGVVERSFYTDEQLAAGIHHPSFEEIRGRIASICTSEKLPDATPAHLFQCAHGMGHAITYALGYNLAKAVEGCGLFPERLHQRSCAIGVFMENIIGDGKEQRLHPDDPLYPCAEIPSGFRDDCYRQVTKTMIWLGYSDEEIATTCRTVPWNHRGACFEAFGRDITQSVRAGKPERVTHACEVLSGRYRDNCIAGAAAVLIDLTWNAEYAHEFCSALEKGHNRRECFEFANFYLNWMYGMSGEELLSECEQFAEEQRELCSKRARHVTAPLLFKVIEDILDDWADFFSFSF
jgi:hypothetical protein